MDASFRLLHQIHARYPPVEARVAETLHFGPHTGVVSLLRRGYHEAINVAQAVVRRFLFITFFALAYVLATVTGWLLHQAFDRWPRLAPHGNHAAGGRYPAPPDGPAHSRLDR